MTFLYVTHDQEEALTMSTEVAVFNEGRIEQIGAPARSTSGRRPSSSPTSSARRTSSSATAGAFVLRPERITFADRRRARGDRDVVFVGAFTRYAVTTNRGERLTVVRQSDGTTLDAARRCTCAWRDGDAFELPGTQPPIHRRTDDQAHVGGIPRAGGVLALPGRRHQQVERRTLNLIAWEGYTQAQWVKPFEKQAAAR